MPQKYIVTATGKKLNIGEIKAKQAKAVPIKNKKLLPPTSTIQTKNISIVTTPNIKGVVPSQEAVTRMEKETTEEIKVNSKKNKGKE